MCSQDDGDAFVLDFGGRQGPSLEYVAYWAMPDGSEGASAVLADLVLHLHSRIAWHGLLAMGGEEKEESWRQARQLGIFSATSAPGRGDYETRANDVERMPVCIAWLDRIFHLRSLPREVTHGEEAGSLPAIGAPPRLKAAGEDGPAAFLQQMPAAKTGASPFVKDATGRVCVYTTAVDDAGRIVRRGAVQAGDVQSVCLRGVTSRKGWKNVNINEVLAQIERDAFAAGAGAAAAGAGDTTGSGDDPATRYSRHPSSPGAVLVAGRLPWGVESARNAARAAAKAAGNADGLDGTDWSNLPEYRCDFPRVAAADLLAAKTAAEREALIGGEAVIITGAISDWKARDRWASPAAFNERYGDHEIRGWHSRRGRAMVGQEGAYPVSEYLADFDQEHGVVYAKAPWEANLHEAINEDWAIPEYLAAASVDRTLSLGGGQWGAPFQRHQVAWLGLTHGRKYWEVAPPHEPVEHSTNAPEH